jgi:T5SS/PEP-CTERM-associated repeat protein
MTTYQWTNEDGTGDFGDPNNWVDPSDDLNGEPGPDDTAVVETSGTITGSGTVSSLALDGTGGVLTMSDVDISAMSLGLQGTVAMAEDSVFDVQQEVTVDGNSIVTAAGGSYIDVEAPSGNYVGLDVGAVSGDNSALDLTGFGTEVELATGIAVLGDAGAGAMTISAGAQLAVDTADDLGDDGLYLGKSVGGQGTLVVTGAYSALDSDGLTVGFLGSGKLVIEAGAEASLSTPVGGPYEELEVGVEIGTNGIVLVTGAGSRLIAPANGSAYIGEDGTGTLTVAAGALAELGSLDIGDTNTGSVSVQGTGSVLELRQYFILGYENANGNIGSGALSVTAGAQVVETGRYGADLGVGGGTSGVISVSGSGSTLNASQSGLFVGTHGTGKITVSSGGTVINGAYEGVGVYLGYASGASGSATVNGAGASWTTSGEFQVGTGGSGTLLVEAGGALKSGDGTNGFLVGGFSGAAGTAEVTGAGSSLTNSGNFLIGYQGTATLMLLAGATITTSAASGSGSDGALIGDFSGSTGHVTVSGTGSKWSIGSDLVVGDAGTGTLIIGAGGLVSAASLATSKTAAGSLGVSGSGAELKVSGNTQFGGTASTSVSIGTGGLIAIGGSTVIEDAKLSLAGGSLTVAKGLTVDASQTIIGNGNVQAASIINAGTIGSSGGTLSFIGGITGTGKLQIGSSTTLSLGGSAASGQTAMFAAATGTLLLGAPTSFAAAIEDFVKGDVIDLSGITASSLTFSGQTLTVHESGGASFGLTFDGTYTSASFAAPKSDGHGGTLISHT